VLCPRRRTARRAITVDEASIKPSSLGSAAPVSLRHFTLGGAPCLTGRSTRTHKCVRVFAAPGPCAPVTSDVRSHVIRLDCSGIRFGSYLDEKYLFEWAMQIPGVLRWEQDTLVVRNRVTEASLRDLLALFRRYNIPMAQLAQFESSANTSWFRDPKKYWYRHVFPGRRQGSANAT
jgi:hypothetical protein